MSLPEQLIAETWTSKVARKIFPLLVWYAKAGRSLTYGELDAEVVKRGWSHSVMAVNYGKPAGTIGDVLIDLSEEWKEEVPPLNAIVVNAATGLPGSGVNYYLERYCERDDIPDLNNRERLSVVQEVHADVFAYQYWDDVLEACSLKPLKRGPTSTRLKTNASPARGGWSNEGESIEHKRLKEYCARNAASFFELDDIVNVHQEYQFASGDKADVVIETETSLVGVEVKSRISNEADLNRGLFQCIKYQALLRAEQRAMRRPATAWAVLVSERELPTLLANLADTLEITCYVKGK
ncbi:hypothetical protein [Desulfovibrio sp. Fe33]|uniref:hypothetical protein n=1 Tax=Desulfovibrio sp. Fe33 TaxID=3020842 RepID=UPI00234DB30C|nr:hypothetical protein [Desulfovibrio sp. Fe33]